MLERWAKIGCENATVGMNGLIKTIIQLIVNTKVTNIFYLTEITQGN